MAIPPQVVTILPLHHLLSTLHSWAERVRHNPRVSLPRSLPQRPLQRCSEETSTLQTPKTSASALFPFNGRDRVVVRCHSPQNQYLRPQPQPRRMTKQPRTILPGGAYFRFSGVIQHTLQLLLTSLQLLLTPFQPLLTPLQPLRSLRKSLPVLPSANRGRGMSCVLDMTA